MDDLRNQALMKRLNRVRILNAIRRNSPIARAQIADLTGLDRKSLTNFVNEFLAEGLVEETGSPPRKGMGRPFTMLEFSRRLVMGIEISAGCVGGVMLDLYGNVHASHRLDDQRINSSPRHLREAVKMVYLKLREAGEVYHGIGVAVQGVVNPARGVVLEAVNVPSAVMDVAAEFAAFASEKIFLEGSSNAAALAEKWFGVGATCDDFVYVEIGAGIGAGIVSDRRLYRGAGTHAGELGHVVIERDGARCRCGNKGCLEAYASESRILEEAGTVSSGVVGRVEDLRVALTPAQAARLLAQMGRRIGLGLAALVNILNPKLIVLGGKIVDLHGGVILPAVCEGVAEAALRVCAEHVEVVASEVAEPIARGAAALVLADVFEVEGHYTS